MQNVIKKLAYVVAFLLLILLVLFGLNYTYISRVNSLEGVDTIHDTDWFSPVVTMAAKANPDPLSISPLALSEQQTRFTESLSYAEKMGSSAFLVWHNGELVAQKFWQGESEDSYMQTFSIHKSIVALAVGIAVERGDIESVQDPVSKYIGQWIDMPYGQITIEHLLTMDSGLALPPLSIDNSIFAHSTKLMYSEDISAVARSLEQIRAPGTMFEYNNSNPQLLIDVIEAATGEKYASYLEQHLWSKVANSSADLWLDRENGSVHGFCCLIAKPVDLLAVGLLILNQGMVNDQQVISKEWINKTTQASNSNPNYGYLTWLGSPFKPMRTYRPTDKFGVIHSAPYLTDDLVFFDGFGGQRVYIVPSKQLVIVRVGAVRFDFDDAFIPNSVIKAITQVE
ncbi:serine hydrolase [Alteromonas sp. M12]|uniref:serine hydrolase domain-containing protein n=1 Tax=Alteromonas sp. M12 TaxID=3135644 RepID=UPI00319E8FDE